MEVRINIQPETLAKLDPLLIKTNRTLKNFIESLIIAAANTNGSHLDLDRVGRIQIKS